MSDFRIGAIYTGTTVYVIIPDDIYPYACVMGRPDAHSTLTISYGELFNFIDNPPKIFSRGEGAVEMDRFFKIIDGISVHLITNGHPWNTDIRLVSDSKWTHDFKTKTEQRHLHPCLRTQGRTSTD